MYLEQKKRVAMLILLPYPNKVFQITGSVLLCTKV
nr:MAG TPA: hypothetical protein [Caudoviricetes sp.]